MTVEEFVFWGMGILGACVGSFLNVCIYRMPLEGLRVGQPARSFCPRCQNAIAWYDNLPVLSWLFLRARCRHCREPISMRYPLVELFTAASFMVVAQHVLQFEAWGTPAGTAALAFFALLVAALIVVTFIDIDHRIIPDEISVTGTAVVLIASYWVPGVPMELNTPGWVTDLFPAGGAGWSWPLVIPAALVGGAVAAWLFRRFSPAYGGGVREWWETRLAAVCGMIAVVLLARYGAGSDANSAKLASSSFGAIVGGGSIYSVGVMGQIVFRKPAMGFGDTKLMALLGAVLGWKGVLVAIFVACLLGSLIGVGMRVLRGSSYIPFGPFLAAGAVIQLFGAAQVASLQQAYFDFSREASPTLLLSVSFTVTFVCLILLWYLRRFSRADDSPFDDEDDTASSGEGSPAASDDGDSSRVSESAKAPTS